MTLSLGGSVTLDSANPDVPIPVVVGTVDPKAWMSLPTSVSTHRW